MFDAQRGITALSFSIFCDLPGALLSSWARKRRRTPSRCELSATGESTSRCVWGPCRAARRVLRWPQEALLAQAQMAREVQAAALRELELAQAAQAAQAQAAEAQARQPPAASQLRGGICDCSSGCLFFGKALPAAPEAELARRSANGEERNQEQEPQEPAEAPEKLLEAQRSEEKKRSERSPARRDDGGSGSLRVSLLTLL